MYQNCLKQADNKYNRALQRIGDQGNTSRCTRPDGCAVPKDSFNPSTTEPPSKECRMGKCTK